MRPIDPSYLKLALQVTMGMRVPIGSSCWCTAGIPGNPNFGGLHTIHCHMTQELVAFLRTEVPDVEAIYEANR